MTTLITERALPGPVAYAAATTWTGATTPACRHCLHQLRRHRPSSSRTQMLPLDACIMQAVIPGEMRQQDARTTTRILRALGNPGLFLFLLFFLSAMIENNKK
jgi:hypothetical protein